MDVSVLEPVFAPHGPYAPAYADVRHTSGTPPRNSSSEEQELTVDGDSSEAAERAMPPGAAMPGEAPVAAVPCSTDASTSSARPRYEESKP